jgi:hypothetical protein
MLLHGDSSRKLLFQMRYLPKLMKDAETERRVLCSAHTLVTKRSESQVLANHRMNGARESSSRVLSMNVIASQHISPQTMPDLSKAPDKTRANFPNTLRLMPMPA